MGNLSLDGTTLVLFPPRTGARLAYAALKPVLRFPAPLTHEPGVPAKRSKADPAPRHPLRVLATIRNPFSRVLSGWYWMRDWPDPLHAEAVALRSAARRSFDAWLAALAEHPSNGGLFPQTELFAHGPRPATLIRFEHQQHDLAQLGVPSPVAPRHGSGATENPGAAYYNRPDRVRAVLDLYAQDFDALGYSRLPPAPRRPA